jgi:hypothetical protein
MKKPKHRSKRQAQINRGNKRTARAKKTQATKVQRREQMENEIAKFEHKKQLAFENLLTSRESYQK